MTGEYDPDYKDVGITYEHMQSVIEDTLVESGYYDIHSTHNGKGQQNGHRGAREKILPHNSPTWFPPIPSFSLVWTCVCVVQMLDKLLKGEWRLGGSVRMGSWVWSAVKEMFIY